MTDVRKIPPVAQRILLFMIRRWDKKGDPMKRSDARYSVRHSNGEDIKQKVLTGIRALLIQGIIVNQIASHEATEIFQQ